MAGTTTSPKVAKKASGVLRSGDTGAASKTAGGSALSQAKAGKVTSAPAAKKSSKVLDDGRTSAASKSAAGSALSQKPAAKKSKRT
jgi:hypothetical protein